MKTDKNSLFFNANLKVGVGTKSWGTALGQGFGKRINRGENILIGMDYCSTPVESVECDLKQSDIIKAAVFQKVFVVCDGQKIRVDRPFILLVTKEKNDGSNENRLSLKFAASTKKRDGSICNSDCLTRISELLGGQKACWFTHGIDVEKQDELVFSIIKVSDTVVSYHDSKERNDAWDRLIEKKSNNNKQIKASFVSWLETNCKSQKKNYKNHIVDLICFLLDEKIPKKNIGNLFRFSKADEFKDEVTRISKLSAFKTLDEKDETHRPKAALGHYLRFLQSIDFSPVQAIYYGVPGCGKSWTINDIVERSLKKQGVADPEYHKIRCVFHPEYCNSDFVGQIYPYVLSDRGGVDYRFKPGPFAEIIRRAYRNPYEPFFLIIEELNRGNAAAIFGEFFQLLDRIKPGDSPEDSTSNIYDDGWSCYGVDNDDVNAYIRQSSSNCSETIEHDDFVRYGENVVIGRNTAIRLPPNLSIYATMNTNDQNVFTLDNAFQRRFKFDMVDDNLENAAQYNIIIGEEDKSHNGVRWGRFRDWINEKILSSNTGLSRSEDKCLGGWFISTKAVFNENGKFQKYENISGKDFAEKVLKYLWHDVFRHGTSGNIFNTDNQSDDGVGRRITSFSEIAREFKNEKNDVFASFKKVFRDIGTMEDELKKPYSSGKNKTKK